MASLLRPFSLRRCHRGFTLLEVMIAVAIIATSLVVLFGSQSRSLSVAAEAQFNTQAATLAAMKLAELEAGIVEMENDEGDFGEEFPGYTWSIEAEDALFERPEGLVDLERPLRKIDLKVSWSEATFSYQLVYYGRPLE